MVGTDTNEIPLFPDREEEWAEEKKVARSGSVVAEMRRYAREVFRPDVRGIISFAAAGRYLGVTEARVRQLAAAQVLRCFRYPALGMVGVAVADVMARRAEREKAKGGGE